MFGCCLLLVVVDLALVCVVLLVDCGVDLAGSVLCDGVYCFGLLDGFVWVFWRGEFVGSLITVGDCCWL